MTQIPAPTDRQVLILWALMVREGAVGFQMDLKPEPSKSDREALKNAGLIEVSKVTPHRRLLLTVTDKGWAWAGDHLDHALPERSTAGATILRTWLARLSVYLSAADVTLAEVVSPQHETAPAGKELPDRFDSQGETRDRIRQAYLAVTGNRLNVRARLAAIRGELDDIAPAHVDAALKAMQREETAVLYPLDNKAEITSADREAAIYFGEEPRHVLWIAR